MFTSGYCGKSWRCLWSYCSSRYTKKSRNLTTLEPILDFKMWNFLVNFTDIYICWYLILTPQMRQKVHLGMNDSEPIYYWSYYKILHSIFVSIMSTSLQSGSKLSMDVINKWTCKIINIKSIIYERHLPLIFHGAIQLINNQSILKCKAISKR